MTEKLHTLDEIRQSVAKIAGYYFIKGKPACKFEWQWKWYDSNNKLVNIVTEAGNYPHEICSLISYDGLIPIIQKQPTVVREKIIRILIGYGDEHTVYTSNQIAKAFFETDVLSLSMALIKATQS